AVAVRAADPQPKADTKPPWQRLLSGDDARNGEELEKRAAELEKAGRHVEAITTAEELLAVRTKVQGGDHWETVKHRWSLAVMKKIAALPEAKRREWQKAREGEEEAARLEQRAEYVRALPLRQERLERCREVLGEDHPATASSYNELALNLYAQGKYAEA